MKHIVSYTSHNQKGGWINEYRKIGLLFIPVLIYFTACILLQLYENSTDVTYKTPDSYSYLAAIDSLYTQGFKTHPSRPFGYPLLIGLPKLINSSKTFFENYILVLQFLMWLSTGWLIYFILTFYLNRKTALVGSLLYSLSLSNIIITFHTLSETAFIFFIALFVFFLVTYLKSRHISALFVSFFCLCFATIIRSISIGLVFVLFFFVLYFVLKQGKHVFINCLLTSAILFSTIGLQVILNYKYYHVFTLSMIGNQTFYHYLCSKAESYEKGISQDEIKKQRVFRENDLALKSNVNEQYKNQMEFYSSDLNYQLKENPINVIRAYSSNVFYGFVNGSEEIHFLKDFHGNKYFTTMKLITYRITIFQNDMYSAILFILLFYFIHKFIKRPDFQIAIYLPFFLWVISFYFYLLSNISTGQGDRFNIVFTPLLIITCLLLIEDHKHFLNSYLSKLFTWLKG